MPERFAGPEPEAKPSPLPERPDVPPEQLAAAAEAAQTQVAEHDGVRLSEQQTAEDTLDAELALLDTMDADMELGDDFDLDLDDAGLDDLLDDLDDLDTEENLDDVVEIEITSPALRTEELKSWLLVELPECQPADEAATFCFQLETERRDVIGPDYDVRHDQDAEQLVLKRFGIEQTSTTAEAVTTVDATSVAEKQGTTQDLQIEEAGVKAENAVAANEQSETQESLGTLSELTDVYNDQLAKLGQVGALEHVLARTDNPEIIARVQSILATVRSLRDIPGGNPSEQAVFADLLDSTALDLSADSSPLIFADLVQRIDHTPGLSDDFKAQVYDRLNVTPPQQLQEIPRDPADFETQLTALSSEQRPVRDAEGNVTGYETVQNHDWIEYSNNGARLYLRPSRSVPNQWEAKAPTPGGVTLTDVIDTNSLTEGLSELNWMTAFQALEQAGFSHPFGGGEFNTGDRGHMKRQYEIFATGVGISPDAGTMWTSADTRQVLDYFQTLHIRGDAGQGDVGQNWKQQLSQVGVWNANTGSWNLEALQFLRTHLDTQQGVGAESFEEISTQLQQHPQIQEWRRLTDPQFTASDHLPERAA